MSAVEAVAASEVPVIGMKRIVALQSIDTGTSTIPKGASFEVRPDEADRLIKIGSAQTIAQSIADSIAIAEGRLHTLTSQRDPIDQALTEVRSELARLTQELEEASAAELAAQDR